MIKKAYQLISLLAIINLSGLIGAGLYLWMSGRLTMERAEIVAQVLRGEYPPEEAPEEATGPGEAERAETQIAQAQAQAGTLLRLLGREYRETEDRQRLVDAAMLDVIRRQEQLEAERGSFRQQQQALLEQRAQDGFQKELELLQSAKPKTRKELLRRKADADVVRVLMAMDERQGKQVIDACRTPEELAWIGRILHRIETFNDLSSAEADRTEQEAQTARDG